MLDYQFDGVALSYQRMLRATVRSTRRQTNAVIREAPLRMSMTAISV
jgi:hypothetical protein